MRLPLAVALALAMSGVAISQTQTGSICVVPVADWLIQNAPADPDVRCPLRPGPHVYAYQIDGRPRVIWSGKNNERVTDLDLNNRHPIRIWCDGVAQQTVTFRFAEHRSQNLCFFLNDLYGTAQLWERAPSCKCK